MPAKINTGYSAEARAKVAAGLSKVLADSYALYQKTHGYHWNVRGPQFASLHVLFQQQYEEEWAALDEIAERIRALGQLAPQGYGALANLTGVKDGDPEQGWEAMVEELMKDNETVIATARAVMAEAEEIDDQPTVDLLTVRTAAHEKHAWMLRSTLGGK